MNESTLEVKTLETPDAQRVFLDGSERREITVGPARLGYGVYQPGWRWSVDVRPQVNRDATAHVGYVLAGRMAVRAADGTEVVVEPGEAFFAAPGHDAWVVGDDPCIALDCPAYETPTS